MQWSLVALLVGVCLPGIAVALPRTIDVALKRVGDLKGGRTLPPRGVIVAAQSIQSLVITALFAIAGAWAATHTGLGAPFFEALLSGKSALAELGGQSLPALGLGVGGALVFLLLYYLVFRPRLDDESVEAMETLRMQIGLWGRVLYGGVVEETMFRFGCMNLLVWGMQAAIGSSGWLPLWIAIIVSGVLFGLGHVPSYRQAGCALTPWFIATEIVLNLFAACIFGWLFATYGLLAAMIGHATFHLVWYPFDRLFASKPSIQVVPSEL